MSLEFHLYPLEPASRRPGPEVVYEIVVDTRGSLKASITQATSEGIDNNLYLLSSLDRDSGGMSLDYLASGDHALEAVLHSGRWYLVVDSGNDSPGRYALTVAFEPLDSHRAPSAPVRH